MKKTILLVVGLLILTGCTNINKADIDTIVLEIQQSKIKVSSETRTGYKYYLPSDLNLLATDNYNEIFLSRDYKYYMYVDIVSYYNKVKFNYEVNPNSYVSKNISYSNIDGYLEVNVKNEKYLIEIMYNYAKIELIVDYGYLKEAIANALIILSTIKYNDDIINNMMGDNILTLGEEQLNIFETNNGESNFLEYLDEYDDYTGDDVLPDPDLLR